MKFIIHDITLFESFLGSLRQLVNSCKFEIFNNKIQVNSTDEQTQTVRVFLECNCISSSEQFSFCLNDVNKFYTSISTISAFIKTSDVQDKKVTLSFESASVKCDDIVKFSLMTVKEEVLSKFIISPMKNSYSIISEFTLTDPLYRQLKQLQSISSDEKPKIYFQQIDNKIYGEIDNKELKIKNNISIPISSSISGELLTVLGVSSDSYNYWNLLKADEISVKCIQNNLNKNKALIISSSVNRNGFITSMTLLTGILK